MRVCFQLLFIKRDAFENASTLLEMFRKYEVMGREVNTDANDAFDVATFPTGHGTYSITPFIPMQQLRWYRLSLQGQRSATASGGLEDDSFTLNVRLDPIDKETQEIIDSTHPEHESLHYDDGGRYAASELQKARWEEGCSRKWQQHSPEEDQKGIDAAVAEYEVRRQQNRMNNKRRKKLLESRIPPHSQPWFYTTWVGLVDLKDVYSIGNVYNNLCSDASDDVSASPTFLFSCDTI